MTALDQLARPAEILLWLHVGADVLGLVALPFVLWWAVRQRRKSYEDYERRHAEIQRELRANRPGRIA